MATKRIIVIGDIHAGHVAALTPPAWQQKTVAAEIHTKHNKFATLQRELWKHWQALLKKWGPFDLGISMGDSIDGTGARSGGTELLTTDRDAQCDIAATIHNHVRLHAKRGFGWYGVYGTGYHTGSDGEDWENVVAERSGFEKIGSHEWLDVNGCIIDIKHHVGGSGVPHGRHTAVAREKLWNVLWAERGLVPTASVVLRGHVHYHGYCGAPGWVAMTTPALQGMGSKYGARRCSGLVDWGIVVIDVAPDGTVDWHADTVTVEAQKARVIQV